MSVPLQLAPGPCLPQARLRPACHRYRAIKALAKRQARQPDDASSSGAAGQQKQQFGVPLLDRLAWLGGGARPGGAGAQFRRGLGASLCVGAGLGAVNTASGGGCGGLGGDGGAGGGGFGGGGGGGWGPSPQGGGAGSPQVLGDVAVTEASADGGVGSGGSAVDAVLILDVTGMKCGGCVGAVQRLLEGHPAVASASVNLATETALVRVTLAQGGSEGSAAAEGEGSTAAGGRDAALDAVGQQLVQALDDGGFGARVRPREGAAWSAADAITSKRADREARLRRSTVDLAVAWGLSLLCGLGHMGHVWKAAPAWMHALHHPVLSATLSAAALLGPGREILVSGMEGLMRGRPDMNTLVGLGAGASFGVSCVAAALPRLGWPTFFEEPAMLLGFVLLGRALEERAKLAASSDMAALQGLVPTRARLLLGGSDAAKAAVTTDTTAAAATAAAAAPGAWADVPAEAVSPGDLLVVLPGDRVPVDGVVVGGRTTVDESALSGEPLPVTKAPGATVTAGTLNCNGAVTVRAEASGQATVIADIVRLVEAAQARTAPIQRLADVVAGKFAYGVMAASAATFAFWSTLGARAFPHVAAAAAAAGASGSLPACCAAAAVKAASAKVAAAAAAGGAAAAAAALPAGATLLLSLQLACNVLVVACPCALGLATPTAVLVGTAAGARRGLLIRGGDVLEATAGVDTVVFDKTGTLTRGAPRVAGVTLLDQGMKEGELLALAAAVERQATHPVARALVAAATEHTGSSGNGAGDGSSRTASHAAAGPSGRSGSGGGVAQHPHVAEGSFQQEPGSGAAAVVGGRVVAVGTLEWVQRHGVSEAEAARASAAAAAPSSSQQQQGSSGSGGQPKIDSGGAVLAGHTQVYVSVGGRLAGTIDVADTVRPDAAATVAALRAAGIRTVMLSGDRREAALAVAAAVGISESDVHAGVKPAGKAALVEELRSAGRRVAMVGDGINDTAALAAADVGVAMGSGVDAASDVASIVLTGDRLGQVAEAVDLSRTTVSKIRQNLVWAFAYNVVGIPLAAGALLPTAGIALTPSLAGALMGVSSLAVMGNSLTLQLWRPKAKAVAAAAVASDAGDSRKAVTAVGRGGGGATGSEDAAGTPLRGVVVVQD